MTSPNSDGPTDNATPVWMTIILFVAVITMAVSKDWPMFAAGGAVALGLIAIVEWSPRNRGK